MENEKIVEEKNVEKKPKNSPISYVIAILILAAVAYVYFCTDMIRMRPLSQEGSAFIGTYEYQVKQSPWDGSYSLADENNNPFHFILTLNEDGTGSWNHGVEANPEDPFTSNDSLVWREENGVAALYIRGYNYDLVFYTNKNGNLVVNKRDSSGKIITGYYDETDGTWIKTA